MPYSVDPHLVRGFDYYTDTLWEVTAAGLGSQNAIGGGGRYDGLSNNSAAARRPASASAADWNACSSPWPNSRQPARPAPTAGLAHPARRCRRGRLLEIAGRAAQAGVACDMDPSGRPVRAQFKIADREKAAAAVVIGESELAAGTVVLKNLKTGTQLSTPQADLVAAIRQLFAQPAKLP